MLQRVDADRGRLSFPFFFDPTFEAEMRSFAEEMPAALREVAQQRRATAPERWDGRRVDRFVGTYGEYLVSKVSQGGPKAARDGLASVAAGATTGGAARSGDP